MCNDNDVNRGIKAISQFINKSLNLCAINLVNN